MLTSRGLGVVLADLSQMGFDAKWGVVSAADVGANHQRERIWIRAEANVANSKSCGSGRNTGKLSTQDEQQTTKRQEGRLWQSDNASQSSAQMADSNCNRWNEWGGDWEERHLLHDINRDASQSEPEWQGRERGIGKIGSNVANTDRTYGKRNKCPERGYEKRTINQQSSWWKVEPNVGRVAHGVAARVDRLKAIGNGQVPLCAATAWELLK